MHLCALVIQNETFTFFSAIYDALFDYVLGVLVWKCSQTEWGSEECALMFINNIKLSSDLLLRLSFLISI